MTNPDRGILLDMHRTVGRIEAKVEGVSTRVDDHGVKINMVELAQARIIRLGGFGAGLAAAVAGALSWLISWIRYGDFFS